MSEDVHRRETGQIQPHPIGEIAERRAREPVAALAREHGVAGVTRLGADIEHRYAGRRSACGEAGTKYYDPRNGSWGWLGDGPLDGCPILGG